MIAPTPREKVILRLVALGVDQPAIAVKLGIRPSEVHAALRALRQKLGASNSPSMVHEAHLAGLLPVGV